MKRLDIVLLTIVLIVSGLLFTALQGKLSNVYLVLIIFSFGLILGLISNTLQRKR